MGNTIGTIIELNHASKLIIKLKLKHASSLKKVTYSSKILKIYSTIQNFDWIGGGVTYRRANDPNLSRNDGLRK